MKKYFLSISRNSIRLGKERRDSLLSWGETDPIRREGEEEGKRKRIRERGRGRREERHDFSSFIRGNWPQRSGEERSERKGGGEMNKREWGWSEVGEGWGGWRTRNKTFLFKRKRGRKKRRDSLSILGESDLKRGRGDEEKEVWRENERWKSNKKRIHARFSYSDAKN